MLVGDNGDRVLEPDALPDSVQGLLLLLWLCGRDQSVAVSVMGLNDVRVIKNSLVVDLGGIEGSFSVNRRVLDLPKTRVTHPDHLIKVRDVDEEDMTIGGIITDQFALNCAGLYLLPFRQSKNTLTVDVGITAKGLEMFDI